MTRQERKTLHRRGVYPTATPIHFTRRKLGDFPGMYGSREHPRSIDPIKPARVERSFEVGSL